MSECIIDTNVALVANPPTHMSTKCSTACVEFIESVLSGEHLVVIDDNYLLIEEYEHFRNSKNPNTYSHRFLRWIYNYQADPKFIKQVKITRIGDSDFTEIPASLNKVGIDASDKKFIAVSIANKCKAPIYEAADSKWIGWEKSLSENGVKVVFLCKDELVEKYKTKMGK
jgi:hypothetical protein